MAKTEMKKVGFNLPTETIDKLEETLRLRNEQLKVTGSSMTKAYYVCGVINSSTISKVIDSYAIGLNRGIDIMPFMTYLEILKQRLKNSIKPNIKLMPRLSHIAI